MKEKEKEKEKKKEKEKTYKFESRAPQLNDTQNYITPTIFVF